MDRPRTAKNLTFDLKDNQKSITDETSSWYKNIFLCEYISKLSVARRIGAQGNLELSTPTLAKQRSSER